MKMLSLAPVLAVALLIAGCGSENNEKPSGAAVVPRDETPAKTPTTKEEKITAIKNSSLPEDQKKSAIERVQAGKL
ncbi:hypothetical protein BH11ARM2_BH11ARM2_09230 [soil metagenome]